MLLLVEKYSVWMFTQVSGTKQTDRLFGLGDRELLLFTFPPITRALQAWRDEEDVAGGDDT